MKYYLCFCILFISLIFQSCFDNGTSSTAQVNNHISSDMNVLSSSSSIGLDSSRYEHWCEIVGSHWTGASNDTCYQIVGMLFKDTLYRKRSLCGRDILLNDSVIMTDIKNFTIDSLVEERIRETNAYTRISDSLFNVLFGDYILRVDTLHNTKWYFTSLRNMEYGVSNDSVTITETVSHKEKVILSYQPANSKITKSDGKIVGGKRIIIYYGYEGEKIINERTFQSSYYPSLSYTEETTSPFTLDIEFHTDSSNRIKLNDIMFIEGNDFEKDTYMGLWPGGDWGQYVSCNKTFDVQYLIPPKVLMPETSNELCNDGKDNDENGNIDCEDEGCKSLFICNLEINDTGLFVDQRDNKEYKWVELNSQIWMAENLSFSNNNTIGYCYTESMSVDTNRVENANCETYGRLYTWFEASSSCPDGWHLPMKEDWEEMIEWIEKLKTSPSIGESLKSDSLWNSNGNGNGNGVNEFKFNGLPAGNIDHYDRNGFIGQAGAWWSNSDNASDADWKWEMFTNGDDITSHFKSKYYAYSVRCLKN